MRRSLQQTKIHTFDGETTGLLWLMDAMNDMMARREIRADNPRAENLCAWMYEAFVTVQQRHTDDFRDVYGFWMKRGADMRLGTICHQPHRPNPPHCRNQTGPCQLGQNPIPLTHSQLERLI